MKIYSYSCPRCGGVEPIETPYITKKCCNCGFSGDGYYETPTKMELVPTLTAIKRYFKGRYFNGGSDE